MDPLCAQYPIPVNNAIFVIGYLGVFLLFYVCVQFPKRYGGMIEAKVGPLSWGSDNAWGILDFFCWVGEKMGRGKAGGGGSVVSHSQYDMAWFESIDWKSKDLQDDTTVLSGPPKGGDGGAQKKRVAKVLDNMLGGSCALTPDDVLKGDPWVVVDKLGLTWYLAPSTYYTIIFWPIILACFLMFVVTQVSCNFSTDMAVRFTCWFWIGNVAILSAMAFETHGLVTGKRVWMGMRSHSTPSGKTKRKATELPTLLLHNFFVYLHLIAVLDVPLMKKFKKPLMHVGPATGLWGSGCFAVKSNGIFAGFGHIAFAQDMPRVGPMQKFYEAQLFRIAIALKGFHADYQADKDEGAAYKGMMALDSAFPDASMKCMRQDMARSGLLFPDCIKGTAHDKQIKDAAHEEREVSFLSNGLGIKGRAQAYYVQAAGKAVDAEYKEILTRVLKSMPGVKWVDKGTEMVGTCNGEKEPAYWIKWCTSKSAKRMEGKYNSDHDPVWVKKFEEPNLDLNDPKYAECRAAQNADVNRSAVVARTPRQMKAIYDHFWSETAGINSMMKDKVGSPNVQVRLKNGHKASEEQAGKQFHYRCMLTNWICTYEKSTYSDIAGHWFPNVAGVQFYKAWACILLIFGLVGRYYFNSCHVAAGSMQMKTRDHNNAEQAAHYKAGTAGWCDTVQGEGAYYIGTLMIVSSLYPAFKTFQKRKLTVDWCNAQKGEKVRMVAEVQWILKNWMDGRAATHFPYKVVRTADPLDLLTDLSTL